MNTTYFLQANTKVLQVLSDRFWVLGVLMILLTTSCSQKEVDHSLLQYSQQKGKLLYHDVPFSGYSVIYYSKDTKSESVGYKNGLRHGKHLKLFKNGTLSYEANYHNGKQEGKASSWWKNGNTRSVQNFKNGVAEGEQKQWYTNGNLFQIIRLKNGQPDGLQQSFRENGKLYNNYEIKNGKVFGLKRSKLCYALKNEKLVRSK